MASSPNHAVRDDDLDVRCARTRQRLLDGIEDTLDELALPDLQSATRRNRGRDSVERRTPHLPAGALPAGEAMQAAALRRASKSARDVALSPR